MEDSSIVQVQQLQILYRRRYSIHATTHVRHIVERSRRSRTSATRRRLFGIGTMAKCQTATDEQASQPWSRRSGVSAANVADGAPALCLNVEYQSPEGWWRSEPTTTAVHQSFWHAEEQSCSSPGDRRRTPGPMFHSHLQTMTGQRAVAGAAGSRHFDRPQRREPTVTAGHILLMVFWNQAIQACL